MSRRATEITGQVFGRLTVLGRAGSHVQPNGTKRPTWLCRCSCGEETVVQGCRLKSGNTSSCGCLHAEKSADTGRAFREKVTIHGHSRLRDGRPSPTYISWYNMKQRCLNPKATHYRHYGGRGITICDGWLSSFEAFLADMGERPAGTSLERIDPNGNYERANTRWADLKEQRANRRAA